MNAVAGSTSLNSLIFFSKFALACTILSEVEFIFSTTAFALSILALDSILSSDDRVPVAAAMVEGVVA